MTSREPLRRGRSERRPDNNPSVAGLRIAAYNPDTIASGLGFGPTDYLRGPSERRANRENKVDKQAEGCAALCRNITQIDRDARCTDTSGWRLRKEVIPLCERVGCREEYAPLWNAQGGSVVAEREWALSPGSKRSPQPPVKRCFVETSVEPSHVGPHL